MNILLIDDMVTRHGILSNAIDSMAAATGQPAQPSVTLQYVPSIEEFVSLTPADLAKIDVFLIDYHLGGERKEVVKPTRTITVGETPRRLRLETGIGVMLHLEHVRQAAEYQHARSSAGRALLYGFTNEADGLLYQLYISAAINWFGIASIKPPRSATWVSLLGKDPAGWINSAPAAASFRYRTAANTLLDALRHEPGPWSGMTEFADWMWVISQGKRDISRLRGALRSRSREVLGNEIDVRTEKDWRRRIDTLESHLRPFLEACQSNMVDVFDFVEITRPFWASDDIRVALDYHRNNS